MSKHSSVQHKVCHYDFHCDSYCLLSRNLDTGSFSNADKIYQRPVIYIWLHNVDAGSSMRCHLHNRSLHLRNCFANFGRKYHNARHHSNLPFNDQIRPNKYLHHHLDTNCNWQLCWCLHNYSGNFNPDLERSVSKISTFNSICNKQNNYCYGNTLPSMDIRSGVRLGK